MASVKQAEKRRTGRAAVALRLAGASFGEIADTLSMVDAKAARDIVEGELAAGEQDPASREVLRAEANARIERLLRGLWQKATDPRDPEHLPAARMALSLVDRHIRLNGLDMPTEVVVYTPTTAEIDTWVAEMLSSAQTPFAEVVEADVLAIEP